MTYRERSLAQRPVRESPPFGAILIRIGIYSRNEHVDRARHSLSDDFHRLAKVRMIDVESEVNPLVGSHVHLLSFLVQLQCGPRLARCGAPVNFLFRDYWRLTALKRLSSQARHLFRTPITRLTIRWRFRTALFHSWTYYHRLDVQFLIILQLHLCH